MKTWNNIYSTINTFTKLHDNVVDLEDLNNGYIIDNYENNCYQFLTHNYVVIIVNKNMKNEHLLEIFEAYLKDADAFDEVVNKFDLLNNNAETVSIFKFISPLTLISMQDKFNFNNMTNIFDFTDVEWKDLEHELSFNKSTDKIGYAFATINTNNIYDDSKCITIEWTVYALLDKNDVTIEDAKKYIVDNLLDKFVKYQFSIIDDDTYYLNFGLTFIEY